MITLNKTVFFILFTLLIITSAASQNSKQTSTISRIKIDVNKNKYYDILYKDSKPDDVPQEVYDALWEIQKEVIDNFTYDNDVLIGKKKYQYMETKEDFYKYGAGICDNYANFFIVLAREKGLTENLYKVSGNRRGGGGHAWLEYRTEKNVYIIDPTWSDDYGYKNETVMEKFRESPAYGKQAFFITYAESSSIFFKQGYYHNTFTYTGKTETALWERD